MDARRFETRRDLRPLPLSAVTFGPGQVIVTMGIGQWDALLSAAYADGPPAPAVADADQPF